MKKNLKGKLFGAMAALGLAVASTVGSTYAWFSLNTEVSASNMQVKAVAEQGILINEVETATDANWDNNATTNQSEGIPLRATSTSNTSKWFVAYSKASGNAASATSGANSESLTDAGYSQLAFAAPNTTAAITGTNAKTDIFYVDKNGDSSYTAGEGYYVKYTYYIKSSSSEPIECGLAATKQSFNIKSVDVVGTNTSANLDKSLRVAVEVNNKAYIYAPLNADAGTYYVGSEHTATTPLKGKQATSLASIPATTANGTPVYVYLYFEGEDANCKTDNITSELDNLKVTVKFSLETNVDAVTDNGVAIG